jgi:hypothetical protein
MTHQIRGFITKDVPVPDKHISVLAGSSCIIGLPISGDKTAVTLMAAGIRFTTVVDNHIIVLDSSHIDLVGFHTSQGVTYDERVPEKAAG